MNQLNTNKPCTTREHVESIEQPGHCVWCGHPMHRDTMPSSAPAVELPDWSKAALGIPLEQSAKVRAPGPRGAALAELAECGSDLATLIVAVAAGFTLKLGPVGFPSYPSLWRGTLKDGNELHVAEGNDLMLVVHQLADNWRHR